MKIIQYQLYLPSSPFIRLEGSNEICCLAALILCFSPLPFSLNLPTSEASWTDVTESYKTRKRVGEQQPNVSLTDQAKRSSSCAILWEGVTILAVTLIFKKYNTGWEQNIVEIFHIHVHQLPPVVSPLSRFSFLFPSFSSSRSFRLQFWPYAQIPCPCFFCRCILPHKTNHKTFLMLRIPAATHSSRTLHSTGCR